MTTWKIRNTIYQSQEIEVFFVRSKGKVVESITLNKEDAILVQKYFKVKAPYDLAGKEFTSPKNNIISAVELLILKLKNGGQYRAPSYQKVLQHTINALSQMQPPDYSSIDKDTVCQSFLSFWGRGLTPNKKWLESFKKDINKASKGIVKVEDTKIPKKRLPAVLGPIFFLDLVSRYGRRQTISIRPYDEPIQFLKF